MILRYPGVSIEGPHHICLDERQNAIAFHAMRVAPNVGRVRATRSTQQTQQQHKNKFQLKTKSSHQLNFPLDDNILDRSLSAAAMVFHHSALVIVRSYSFDVVNGMISPRFLPDC